MRAPRPLLGMTAIIAGLALTATGCDPGGDDRAGDTASQVPAAPAGPDRRPAIASAMSTRAARNPQVKVDLVGLNRFGPRHLVVQLRVTNSGADTLNVGEQLKDEGSDEDGSVPDGIALIDTAARRLLEPYRRTDGKGCLCTPEKEDFGAYVDPGESQTWFAVLPFTPSGHPKTATVYTPLARPFVNVPISDAPPTAPPSDAIPSPDATPVRTIAHPIDARAEALDGTTEIHDDGDQVKVSLSSDVLFRLNQTALTPRAEALRRTAAQIDASPGRTVRIEGHADSSGTDSINDPLSARRADTVRAKLSTLVTRTGVTFDAKGYGSHRPLWSNDTEEGAAATGASRSSSSARRRPPPYPRPPWPFGAGHREERRRQDDLLRPRHGRPCAGRRLRRPDLRDHEHGHGRGRRPRPGLRRGMDAAQVLGGRQRRAGRPVRRNALPRRPLRPRHGQPLGTLSVHRDGGHPDRHGVPVPREKKEFWAIVKLPPGATTDVSLTSFPASPASRSPNLPTTDGARRHGPRRSAAATRRS